jgi:hypothetical protein
MIISSGCPGSNQRRHYETHCGHLMKILFWDGQGLVLYAKYLVSH